MKRFYERHVPHLPQRMFDVVSDLSNYPRFIPNCQAMQVRSDPAAPAGGNVLLARMTIAFGPITTSTAFGVLSPKGRARGSALRSTSRFPIR